MKGGPRRALFSFFQRSGKATKIVNFDRFFGQKMRPHLPLYSELKRTYAYMIRMLELCECVWGVGVEDVGCWDRMIGWKERWSTS